MNKSSHLIAGVTVGIYLSSQLELSPTNSILCVGFSAIGSLLPDIDTPSSWLGRRILILSYPISKLFGHRTITHSLLFWTVLFIIYPHFYSGLSHGVICYGVYGGVLSHLILDLFSPVGIPLFYPVYNKRFKLYIKKKRKRRKRLPI